MKAEFWHERWQSDQLGFHQAEVNARLVEHWPALDPWLGPPAEAAVFVPLCGKSLDMVWLRERGHPVVGIELSAIAIRDFFAAVDVTPRIEEQGPLVCSSGAGYTLYCGDFFDLGPEQLADISGVYDRAALIALPPELRARYVEHSIRILPPDVSILLIGLEYDQARMSGPPHSVPPSEIERRYGGAFEIERLASSGWGQAQERFRERGLDEWCETVFRLSRAGAARTKGAGATP